MTTIKTTRDDRARSLLKFGPLPPQVLQQALGVSQPTLSRLATRLSGQIAAIGRGRSTQYGLLREVRGAPGAFPVYRIDARGNPHILGQLLCLHGGQFGWVAPREGKLLYGLPWFLQDQRPEGFVGQAFAGAQRSILGLPETIGDWSDEDALVALSRLGEDCVGNLVIGDESLTRYLRASNTGPTLISPADRARVYPQLARAVESGEFLGPLVGGAQPKFTAVVKSTRLRHVLVKFSPSVQTEPGRRWADLLVCEHLALQVLAAAGICAAGSRIVEADDRVFLEVDRFDRVGKYGRTPIVSLGAVEDEFFGRRDNWSAAADRMQAGRMLGQTDARRLRWLATFGDLIGNTDQHFGNISLIMVGDRKFTLAPAYDMLPMAYKPGKDAVPANPLPFGAEAQDAEDDARAWATRFWNRAGADSRVSREFRQICRENREALQAGHGGLEAVLRRS